MKQLIIKGFNHPPNITISSIKRYMHDSEEYLLPNNKEIRLAIDLAKQKAPMNFDRNNVVRSILRCCVSDERINNVKPFKKITKKRLITVSNGKARVINVIRNRNK